MSIPFDGSRGLIVVHAEVNGPSGSGVFRLALDTGATGTVNGSHLLTALGYDLKAATESVEVTTGSGV